MQLNIVDPIYRTRRTRNSKRINDDITDSFSKRLNDHRRDEDSSHDARAAFDSNAQNFKVKVYKAREWMGRGGH